jgi:tripartite-type tricarboxylate transporter receptor subunit TctC
VFARTISSHLAQQLQQTVVIENRPGANGTIGSRAVAMAAPDGYTLLLANSTFATNASSRKNLPYDPLKDFVPIAGIGRSAGSLMTVSTKTPIRTRPNSSAKRNDQRCSLLRPALETPPI